jgi:hypothetical protein
MFALSRLVRFLRQRCVPSGRLPCSLARNARPLISPHAASGRFTRDVGGADRETASALRTGEEYGAAHFARHDNADIKISLYRRANRRHAERWPLPPICRARSRPRWAAAPIGKYPKYPVGKYPIGKYPQPVVTQGLMQTIVCFRKHGRFVRATQCACAFSRLTADIGGRR